MACIVAPEEGGDVCIAGNIVLSRTSLREYLSDETTNSKIIPNIRKHSFSHSTNIEHIFCARYSTIHGDTQRPEHTSKSLDSSEENWSTNACASGAQKINTAG